MDALNEIIAGSVGGAAGILVGSPLDVAKTRMQASGKKAFNMRSCFAEILREDGPKGLFRGVLPPLMGQMLYTSVSFAGYGRAVSALENRFGAVDSHKSYDFVYSMVGGSFAGFLTSFVSTPFELLKVQEQVTHEKMSPIRQLRNSTRIVVQSKGPLGLYAGWGITAIRDTPSTGMYFIVYYEGKEVLGNQIYGTDDSSKQGYGGRTMIELVSGGLAGVVSWGMAIPWDVIKTRIQWDAVQCGDRQYNGIIDCFRKVYSEEGAKGFTRGAIPIIARAFPVNAVTFLTYENVMNQLEK